MLIENLKIGKFYSSGDDSLYKVVDKGNDWVLVLVFSYNHRVANPWIFSSSDKILSEWREDEDSFNEGIFESLRFEDYYTLKES